MVYCTKCGDKHDYTGKCNYCDCKIVLRDRYTGQTYTFDDAYRSTGRMPVTTPDRAVEQGRNFGKVYGGFDHSPVSAGRPNPDAHAEHIDATRERLKEQLRTRAVFGEVQGYLRKYAPLTLVDLIERLGKAEDALDNILNSESANGMYSEADEYRRKYPKL